MVYFALAARSRHRLTRLCFRSALVFGHKNAPVSATGSSEKSPEPSAYIVTYLHSEDLVTLALSVAGYYKTCFNMISFSTYRGCAMHIFSTHI